MHIFFRNRFLTTAVVWNKQILHTRTYTNTLIVWAVPFPFLVSVKGVFRKCGTRVPILLLLDCQQSNIWACGVFDTFETPSESAQGRIVRNRPSTAPNWSKVKTRHQLRVCGRCGTTVAKCKTHTHSNTAQGLALQFMRIILGMQQHTWNTFSHTQRRSNIYVGVCLSIILQTQWRAILRKDSQGYVRCLPSGMKP